MSRTTKSKLTWPLEVLQRVVGLGPLATWIKMLFKPSKKYHHKFPLKDASLSQERTYLITFPQHISHQSAITTILQAIRSWKSRPTKKKHSTSSSKCQSMASTTSVSSSSQKMQYQLISPG